MRTESKVKDAGAGGDLMRLGSAASQIATGVRGLRDHLNRQAISQA